MNKISVFAILTTLLMTSVVFAQNKNSSAGEKNRDGVFIHISSGPENPHRVVMALKMATTIAADKDVLVYFDIKGIEVVLNDAKDVSYPTFPSAQESIKMLLDKGITVCACPGCLKAAGKSGADLMPGVLVAEKDRFFGFTKGRILTLDY